jgi:FtsP/CotA-like multicopper oxidase with cupredoxin domain
VDIERERDIDAVEIPSGRYEDYIESIKAGLIIIKPFIPAILKSLADACSPLRAECYGTCLPKILDSLAECFEEFNHLQFLKIFTCLTDKIQALEENCSPCVCQILILVFNKWFDKGLVPSSCHTPHLPVDYNCQDRDCSTSSPRKCVFNFTLEATQTDEDGRRADGRLRSVLTYNGRLPGPPLVICEGDELRVNFENQIKGSMTEDDGSTNTTTLHFHGIRELNRPWSDGVPFVTQCPISPGDESFPYGFDTRNDVNGAPPGTYWYHSHVGAQRTNGAYGALIIKPKNMNRYQTYDPSYPAIDVDDASNTLVLQEWYENATKQTPVSILINGNGRVGKEKLSGTAEENMNYLQAKGQDFQCTNNDEYTGTFTTNYTEFEVAANMSYRFRIIGAISQNLPLQVSIEDHTFTAIAADSLDIQPVHNLTNVWLAAGERYDIIIKTKPQIDERTEAYKIKVLGFTNVNEKRSPLCSIAWLKYPGQTIDYSYVTTCNCSDFDTDGNTLNPVPNNLTDWNESPDNGKYFIKDIKSVKNEPTINFANGAANLNTQYIEFVGDITFNNKRMEYPDIPFLLQNPQITNGRCGSKCEPYIDGHGLNGLKTRCTTLDCPGPVSAAGYCECQHVIQQPWAPGYWAETVLINNNKDAAAHPIHQHGGWYWVVGMGKYDHNISRTFIEEQDRIGNLSRNFDYAVPKDTLQIPQNGYAIIRTKLDNAGTWIFHCHINFHVEIGMALVLQIGELGKNPLYGQNWCIEHEEENTPCKTSPTPPGGGPGFINWWLHMSPATRCVKPGNTVTWNWVFKDHNVNLITEKQYDQCDVDNSDHNTGDYVWPPPGTSAAPGTYYFACGRGGGYHCNHGMKAKVTVSTDCPEGEGGTTARMGK